MKRSLLLRQSLKSGWPGLEGASPKLRGFLHFVQSSPGHSNLNPAREKLRRCGAIFHYYLAYVTLVSSILIMTGNVLHTILRHYKHQILLQNAPKQHIYHHFL